MGRAPQPGEFIQCVGNFSAVDYGREAMGMPWASREGLREAIPPAYTEHIGGYLLNAVTREGVAA
jgi:DNA (cytosine-5)-methyltransferase 1